MTYATRDTKQLHKYIQVIHYLRTLRPLLLAEAPLGGVYRSYIKCPDT